MPWRSEGALTSSSSKLGPREGRLPLPRCSFGPPLLTAHSPEGGKEKFREGMFRTAEGKAVDMLPWPRVSMHTAGAWASSTFSASFLVHLPALGYLRICPVV